MIRHFSCVLLLSITVGATSALANTCISDITNDGETNINDLLTLLNNWGSCPSPCAADIAAPWGIVDVSDLLVVLTGWGPCPCLAANGCVQGVSLWCEDWETGNYSRWTGGYESSPPCGNSGFTTQHSVSANTSHWSRITCTSSQSHRGYGGLRFQGDHMVPSFHTGSSGGTSAPHGVLVRFSVRVETPHTFSPWQWLSLMTATHDCSNNWSGVITLNIDDATRRLKPVHVGSVTYAPNAPAFPLGQWVRITVFLNYNTGSMHVWQNGTKVVSAAFTRPVNTICQWHWGLYASGNNSDILMHEDDFRIIKLTQPLTNFTMEPWVPGLGGSCN